ncbi:MAG: hypothetical protein M3O62_05955 [Pseudomonadota bacterium]|nr:hypothetical protein [Pseudomonadota bacterium]
MSRTVQGMAIVSIIAWASAAVALGLGDIDVRSRLNQPLSARIAINAAPDDVVSDLKVAVASNAEFDRAGVERIPYLSTLRFEVKEDGAPYIQVSSDQPAREPFVLLLLDVRDRGNKIIREYSMFLDPAEYVPPESADSDFYETVSETSQAVAVAPADPPAVEPIYSEPTRSEPAASRPVEPVAASEPEAPVYDAPTAKESEATYTPEASGTALAAAGSYGPISAGETLWSIATRARPQGASMDQVLLAIYTGNPAAFDGGINGLRKGVVLQLPDADAVMAVSPAAAKEEVRRLRGLRSAAKQRASAEAAVETAAIVPTEIQATPAPTARPTAIPTAEPTPIPTAVPTVEPTALPTAEATTEASPDAVLEAPAIASDTATADLSQTADPSSTENTQALTTAEGAAQETSEAAPTPVATAATQDIVVDSVKKKRPKKESGLFETLLLPLIAGLVVLVGAILLWLRFRSKRNADGDFSALGNGAIARPAATPKPSEPVVKPSNSRQKLEELDRDLDRDVGRAKEAKTQQFAPPPKPDMPTQRMPALDVETQQIQPQEIQLANLPLEQTAHPMGDITLSDGGKPQNLDFDLTGQFESQTMQINLDTNDPLSEADFHLAYGLFDEAALLLKQAISKEPARADLQIKLAETYFAAGKASEFEAAAGALRPLVSDIEWQKIAIMGQQLAPSSGLFAATQGGSAVENDAVDLDLGATADVGVKAGDTGNLAFSLDSFDEPAPQPAAPKTKTVAEPEARDTEGSIEFDLGEFDLAAPAPSSPPPASNSKLEASSADDAAFLDFDLEVGEPAKAAIEALDFEAAKGNVDAGISFDLTTSEVPTLKGMKGKALPDIASFGSTMSTATAETHFGDGDVGLDNVDLGDLDGGFAVSGADDAATKLDLARAYVDMGDNEMARSLLGEVMQQGNDAQKQDAATLLQMLG